MVKRARCSCAGTKWDFCSVSSSAKPMHQRIKGRSMMIMSHSFKSQNVLWFGVHSSWTSRFHLWIVWFNLIPSTDILLFCADPIPTCGQIQYQHVAYNGKSNSKFKSMKHPPLRHAIHACFLCSPDYHVTEHGWSQKAQIDQVILHT